MVEESGESGGTDRPGRPNLSRRGLLRLSGVGVSTSLAGCGESRSRGGGASPTRTATAATPTQSSIDPGPLAGSPSSHVAPTDGFADLSWLGEVTPRVLRVTNLDNAGEGSLRWALETVEPRIVVFEVGGVVDLQDQNVEVAGDNLYVAGQTAPSPGITLVRGGVVIDAHNVFLQHVRVRPGDEITGPVDGIGNGGGNVIVDHCSVTWSSDESISTNSGWQNPDVTFTNNVAAECLNDSVHPEGEHSYGTLVMDRSSSVTVAGNLWAHNTGRHPRLKGGSSSVVANNVTYDFERAVRLGGGVDMETTASIVGNYYEPGEQDVSPPIVGGTFTGAEGPVTVYAAYNSHPGIPLAADDSRITFVDERPLWPETLSPVGGGEAYEAVLASAGARPADRTPHDERVVADVREGTGSQIDSQAEVGGYPELEPTERPLDVPREGLAEWLFQHARAVELPDAEPP